MRFIPLEKYPVACHGVEYTSFNEGEGLIPRPSFLTGFISVIMFISIFIIAEEALSEKERVISEQNQELLTNLKRHTSILSQEIGERNFMHYQNLERAADYIKQEFKNYGYEIEEQVYHLEKKPFRNVIAIKKGRVLADKIIPNFAIAKFAPKGSFGKSDEDLPILRGNPGFFDRTILCICKIWDTLSPEIAKRFRGFYPGNPLDSTGQNRPNSRRVWSCSPSLSLGADFSNEKSGIIIVCAHYDSVWGSPGADDNASGVAGLLELARLISSEDLNKTIRFIAFTNEEPPFFMSSQMGSFQYAGEAKKRRDDIEGVLCLESIGYYSERPKSQRYPFGLSFFYPDKGNFVVIASNFFSRGLLKRIVKEFKRVSNFPIEYLSLPTIFAPAISFSDHWSFWKFGYRAVMITDTAFYRTPYYHTPQDTLERLNYAYMAEVIRGLFGVLIDLCITNARIPTNCTRILTNKFR